MSSFEDGIWAHLVEHHDADCVDVRIPTRPERSVRPVAATASAAVLAGVVALVVLVLSVSSGAPPAYALTRIAAGSYTVSLNDIATGIPALNAKFARLGIPVTAVPVKARCTASSFDPVEAVPGSARRTVTITSHDIPSGRRGYLAAEQLRNGRVLLAEGTTAGPIPSCFPKTTSHGIPSPGNG